MSALQYIEKGYDESSRLRRESIFHTASGQLGVRGCYEEGAPGEAISIRGAYLNGFCECEAIHYNERLAGFPDDKQIIVNLPDAQTIRLCANGQYVSCIGREDLVQTLDMDNGCCIREFGFDAPGGKLGVRFTRLASFVMPNVFAIECRVTSENFSGELSVTSTLNPDVRNFTSADDPRVASGDGRMLRTVSSRAENGEMTVVCETINSRRRVGCAVTHDVAMDTAVDGATGLITAKNTFIIAPGQTVKFCKYCVYHELAHGYGEDMLVSGLRKAAGTGFEKLMADQRGYLDGFWRNSRVLIGGNPELQTQLDFSLYGMLSSAGRDGATSVAAKGLSGEGYEGHYFWDCEIYIFPFFLQTNPAAARSLLEYRYSVLDAARAHARRLGHEAGALYPWRTITGSECSSYYPSGSAQYHINGDISHAFLTYWESTNDESFLEKCCEVLVETSRLWIDTGHRGEDGRFRIDCVTGPDEYTCVVNNNYYTNAGAAENLIGAADLCGEYEKRFGPEAFEELSGRLNLTKEELDEFRSAGNDMFYPCSEKLGIVAQDDSFLSKKRWDIASIPGENFPLLMHYHPLVINRYQILKQADAVLANFIYREEDTLTMMRTFRYYEEITTHDSSLSNCIYAIMAARLGCLDDAVRYFMRCIGTDIGDRNGNTRDGLHIANMGGVYRVMTSGFGGLRISGDGLSLFPLVPDIVTQLEFPVSFMGRRLLVRAGSEGCFVKVVEGEPIDISVYGRHVTADSEGVLVRRRMEAVIFDLDGVITDTAVFHYMAWKELADELGIEFNERLNEQFKGVSRAECLKLLLQWGERDVTSEEFGQLLKKKNDIYVNLLSTLTPSGILPGISGCLAGLRARGIPVALFSVSKNTGYILARLGLENAFDAIVTGNEISRSKPHFEGYLKAAGLLKTDSRLCVMVEDSVAGIEGAKALSMGTVAVMDENRASADICVSDTSGISAALDKLL